MITKNKGRHKDNKKIATKLYIPYEGVYFTQKGKLAQAT